MAAHLGRALEALWLATAVAVPLIIIHPGTMLAYVEVPKVALLRTLVGLMAVLWVMEWVVRPEKGWPRPRGWRWRGLGRWLREDPTRWLVLALGNFLGVNVLATLLSVSPPISLWGKEPGWDGYGLYTMLSYALLFLVVATHLKTPAQLWRLLAAVIATGVLVGGYSILQHHDLDPILQGAGVRGGRTMSTLGNPIFAAAFLLMTAVLTLAGGLILQLRWKTWWPLVVTGGALAVQLLGIGYTLSRGPWAGLAAGLVILLTLLWVALGARCVARAALTLLLALAISIGIAFIPSASEATGTQPKADVGDPSAPLFPSGQLLVGRGLSILPAVAGGWSGRVSFWKGALQLSRDRPWVEGIPQPFSWVRPLLGYGPETFRVVFPLRSPPKAGPPWAHEAHNVPLHVLVELGPLGLLSLVVVAAALLLVGLRLLLRSPRHGGTQRILLAGLLATFAGRGVEMMAGIPKASDLALTAILLAMLVALPRVIAAPGASDPPQEVPLTPPLARPTRGDWAGLVARAFLGFILIVALGAFTMIKTVNYARADWIAATAFSSLADGEPEQPLRLLREATKLAPDMPAYHLFLGKVFTAIGEATTDPENQLRAAMATYLSNLAAVRANSLYVEARAAAADAALDLARLGQPGKLEEAIDYYQEVAAMLPRFGVSHYALALAYLVAQKPREALSQLDLADSLSAGDPNHAQAVGAESAYLRGVAHRQLGDLSAAVDALERSLALAPGGRYASRAHGHLAELYTALGDPVKSAEHDRLAR